MKSFLLVPTLLLALSQCAIAQTKLAFVVGVERYEKSGLKNLDYAEDDARQVEAALKKLGFSVLPVIGDEARLANLNTKLDSFITQTQKLGKADIVIVYFSGHGVQKLVNRKNADGRLIEVEEPFFCPKDALKSDTTTLLSLNTVLERLERSSGSERNIIMLDACRESADKSGKGGIDGSSIRELSDKISLFFAAKSGRRSFESKVLKHGIFTHYLLEGLSGKAADEDNEVTFQGLANYVTKQVERNSPRLLEVSAENAQQPNLMGTSGTIVLGRVDRAKTPIKPAKPLTSPPSNTPKPRSEPPTSPPSNTPKPRFEPPTSPAASNSSSDAKTSSNKLGMRFVRIEPGEFMMGNEDSINELLELFPHASKNSFDDAAKRHLVKITRPYYLGEHEVTVGQFQSFVNATAYNTEAESDRKGGYGIDKKGDWKQDVAYNWRNPGFRQLEDHPVVNISWNDAQKFIAWLSKEEGRTYRLPTEAEWEYACRAGTRTRYWNGNEPEALAKIGNVSELTATSPDGFVNTAPVGSFKPNPWGLYDMHGNVLEWCSDWYEEEYTSGSVSDPKGPKSGSARVYRGGGWYYFASDCRSAYRFRGAPDVRFSGLGFRVVMDPKPF